MKKSNERERELRAVSSQTHEDHATEERNPEIKNKTQIRWSREHTREAGLQPFFILLYVYIFKPSSHKWLRIRVACFPLKARQCSKNRKCPKVPLSFALIGQYGWVQNVCIVQRRKTRTQTTICVCVLPNGMQVQEFSRFLPPSSTECLRITDSDWKYVCLWSVMDRHPSVPGVYSDLPSSAFPGLTHHKPGQD